MVQSLTRDFAVLDTKHTETEKQGVENRKNIGDVFRRLTTLEVRISILVAIIVAAVNIAAKYLLP